MLRCLTVQPIGPFGGLWGALLHFLGGYMPKVLKSRLAAIPAFVLATTGAAHAALPTGVTDAVTAAGEDMVSAVTAIIVAFVAFWGLRKLGAKLGWI